MYVSITNTDIIMVILMISRKRDGHWNYVVETERGLGPPSTFGYAEGHRFQMYVSNTNTEEMLAILLFHKVAAAVLEL